MERPRMSTVIFAMAMLALFSLPGSWAAEAPPAGPSPGPAKMDGKSGCACDCDACGKECPHGGMHPHHGKHAMMEGMKKHMEEVRKSVAALREHEKKMEGITDPAAFRKAALEHFRMLDDLNESHVKHMDSMMGGGGHEHMHPGN